MGAVFFYELQGAPLEVTLPMLIEKARGQGWRVLVRGTTRLYWHGWMTRCGKAPWTHFCRMVWLVGRMMPTSQCCWAMCLLRILPV